METSYQKIIRCGNDELKKDVRTEIAIYACDHGIAKTVEDYNIVKNTARKWRDRYRRGEPMTDRSRKPERQSNQIAPYWRCLIIDKAEIEIARLQAQRANNSKPIVISASWLQKKYRIPLQPENDSQSIASRRPEADKTSPCRRPAVVRYSCSQTAASAIRLIMIDVKHLDDIHGYAWRIAHHNCHRYMFVARDVRTGMVIFAVARQKSSTHAQYFIDYVAASSCGVRSRRGTGYLSNRQRIGIHDVVQSGSLRRFYRYHSSEVGRSAPVNTARTEELAERCESFNRLSEDEFFVHVQPNTPEELLAAATQYVRYFNTERHNSYKGATPRELLQKAAPAIDPRVSLCTGHRSRSGDEPNNADRVRSVSQAGTGDQAPGTDTHTHAHAGVPAACANQRSEGCARQGVLG